MRDRYLGLVLAVLAWVLAPVSFARASGSVEQEARTAITLASPAVVQRGQSNDDRQLATTSGSIDLASSYAHPHATTSALAVAPCSIDSLHTAASLGSAQPRGPPR
jgi:hypothetical protein